MSFAVVMSYPDRSGVLAVFGPYATQEQAVEVAKSLNDSTWIQSGAYDVLSMVDQFGAQLQPAQNAGYVASCEHPNHPNFPDDCLFPKSGYGDGPTYGERLAHAAATGCSCPPPYGKSIAPDPFCPMHHKSHSGVSDDQPR